MTLIYEVLSVIMFANTTKLSLSKMLFICRNCPTYSFTMSCSCPNSICETAQQWNQGYVLPSQICTWSGCYKRRCGIVTMIFHLCVRMTITGFFGMCQSKQIGLLKLTGLTLLFSANKIIFTLSKFSCPFDTNMSKKHEEKIFKYQSL